MSLEMTNKKMYIVVVVMLLLQLPALAQQKTVDKGKPAPYAGYLFAYFTGNAKAEEQIRFAISKDGFKYTVLNKNNAVIGSDSISENGAVRDPHILRGNDGLFYMVVTDMASSKGWSSNRGIVLMKSADLIHWSSSAINFQKRFSAQDSLKRVWAPQTIYDPVAKKYMVYFSTKYGNEPDKICYAYANKDFTDLEAVPTQLFFSPDNAACIDGDIVVKDKKYYLFFKTEDRLPGIKLAVSDQLTSGYTMHSNNYVQQTKNPVEGAGTFKLNDGSGYILMYDMYTSGRYQFTKTTDLEHFEVVDNDVRMNFHPRHGTVMPITAAEFTRLFTKWGAAEDVLQSVQATQVKKINIAIDTTQHVVTLPVLPGTNFSKFDPLFAAMPGVAITPRGTQNFSKGPITYSVAIGNKKPVQYKVGLAENHNPVIAGLYADPDVLYSNKTKRYYLYPTSDGFTSWSGTYFKTFSSTDLVNWKDEGTILDLEKDVTWAKRNAWAPTIIERKNGEDYNYYYYFCAAQKIGVAVSNHPTGPFKDSDKPLVDKKPEGTNRGQEIDPQVFRDPASGKHLLYWGNGYLAVSELNDDMVSFKEGTTQLIRVDKTFREGVYVFYRKGLYYFMWSEDDTRSENYRVRYGTAGSPFGPINISSNNLVIAKDAANGIYGTGHNSVLNIPGTDDWYIIYHRFNYPNGIKMGGAAGYNREVCIDKMEFNADGTIQPVVPTHKGIEPLKVKADQ
ncbi:MAG TPA: family 43 glycosylhydrolase [Phnomibacter sp.]|nr:family 43 glycosylhydrolase [Phnomibacter sp.]